MKLAGGPTLSIYVDIVKNQDALLDVETLNYYDFLWKTGTDRQSSAICDHVSSPCRFALCLVLWQIVY